MRGTELGIGLVDGYLYAVSPLLSSAPARQFPANARVPGRGGRGRGPHTPIIVGVATAVVGIAAVALRPLPVWHPHSTTAHMTALVNPTLTLVSIGFSILCGSRSAAAIGAKRRPPRSGRSRRCWRWSPEVHRTLHPQIVCVSTRYSWRVAASASSAKSRRTSKNSFDCPMNRPSCVKAVTAPIATPLVAVGRTMEQAGKCALRN